MGAHLSVDYDGVSAVVSTGTMGQSTLAMAQHAASAHLYEQSPSTMNTPGACSGPVDSAGAIAAAYAQAPGVGHNGEYSSGGQGDYGGGYDDGSGMSPGDGNGYTVDAPPQPPSGGVTPYWSVAVAHPDVLDVTCMIFFQVTELQAGGILGKGGWQIKEITQFTRTKIQLSPRDTAGGVDAMRTVEITGRAEDVQAAHLLLLKCMKTAEEEKGNAPR